MLCFTVLILGLVFVKNVKMSKTFIGGAVCREFKSEAPAAEKMLD